MSKVLLTTRGTTARSGSAIHLFAGIANDLPFRGYLTAITPRLERLGGRRAASN